MDIIGNLNNKIMKKEKTLRKVIKKEKTELGFDPSDKILGVFDEWIYIEGIDHSKGSNEWDCVLAIQRNEFLRIFNIWLDGKKDYCERFNHFCGQMGTADVVKFAKQGTIDINRWNEKKEDYDVLIVPLYFVTKVGNQCYFEHG
jgi:hypothetical protein